MRQLTSLDAQFLAVEDGKTHGHVSALGIYDPSNAPDGVLTRATITELIGARIHLIAPFRWRLVEVPLSLDHPYWVEEPEFDLDYHVRELALPAPGDDVQLTEQVARIVARPLDRSRPLWELYVIQGFAGGRVGVLTKVHHAAIDGMSGAEILGVLLEPEEAVALTPRQSAGASGAPGQWGMLARGLAGVPRQPLNAPIGPHRRVAISRQSLDDVKLIKSHYRVTVNDVVMAICAGALRIWLDARGELPDEPLLALVPMSVRTEQQQGTFGNRVTTMLAPLPTQIADPEARLLAAHDAMRAAKEHHSAVPATVLQDANEVIPPAMFARAARVSARIAARHPTQAPVNVLISNIPGSPVPLHLAGAELEALYPVSAILHGVGLNITVMSYCGGLDFGIVADRDLVDDAWPIAAALREAQAELLALVSQRAAV